MDQQLDLLLLGPLRAGGDGLFLRIEGVAAVAALRLNGPAVASGNNMDVLPLAWLSPEVIGSSFPRARRTPVSGVVRQASAQAFTSS